MAAKAQVVATLVEVRWEVLMAVGATVVATLEAVHTAAVARVEASLGVVTEEEKMGAAAEEEEVEVARMEMDGKVVAVAHELRSA